VQIVKKVKNYFTEQELAKKDFDSPPNEFK
jgi:hypothetical protein